MDDKTPHTALLLIVGTVMFIFIWFAIDCSIYIWFFPDMQSDAQRCGPAARKDHMAALKEMCSLVLAFMAGRSSTR